MGGKFLEGVESIDGSIQLTTNELLLGLQGFSLKSERGFCFGGTESGFREDVSQFPVFQFSQNGEEHRSGDTRTEARRAQMLARLHHAAGGVVSRSCFRQNGRDGFR